MSRPRTFAYVLLDDHAKNRSAQKAALDAYCKTIARPVDGFYADVPDSFNLDLIQRPAGERLLVALRPGDHVVTQCAHVARSLMEFGRLLERWTNAGIVLHLTDLEVVLDPQHPYAQILVRILISFARNDRRMIGLRTLKTLKTLKTAGRRFTALCPFGSRYERHGKNTIMVPDAKEQAILQRVIEMRTQGYSVDEIRQYLAYEWRVRNRNGNEFGKTEIQRMIKREAELLEPKEPQPAKA